ncbi:MAG: JAB domain-containing protein [candidate division WOR-3 bacterium]
MIIKESKIIYNEIKIPGRPIKLKNKSSIVKFVSKVMGSVNSPAEYLIVIAIDDNAQPVSFTIMGCSVEDEVHFSISSVLRFVILSGCNKFITIHNHPNDVCKFSKEDIKSAIELKKAASVVGLELVSDYLIYSGGCLRNKNI